MSSRLSAAALLAAFQSPTSSPQKVSLGSQFSPTRMDVGNNISQLRTPDVSRSPITIHSAETSISSSTQENSTSSSTQSSPATPLSPENQQLIPLSSSMIRLSPSALIDDDSSDESVIEIARMPSPAPPAPVQTRLRQSARITRPSATPTHKIARPKKTKTKTSIKSDALAISKSIAKGKTDNFLLRNRHLFLSLLPERNYISQLQQNDKSATESTNEAEVTPRHVVELMIGQPPGMTACLKPHQRLGLKFLVRAHDDCAATILGDEMGLGKTIQTLAFLQYLKDSTPGNKPMHLIVCPLSVLNTWIGEARRFTPDLKIFKFHGPHSVRQSLKQHLQARKKADQPQYDCVVVTYEMVVSEESWLSSVKWSYVILDEGHKIKNASSKISRSCQKLKGYNRLILTGTPVQNNLFELWSMLSWLYPNVFSSATQDLFKKAFNLSRGSVDTGFMRHCDNLLQKIMLRRLINNIDLQLPLKKELFLFAPLSPLQRACYQRMITGAGDDIIGGIFDNVHDPATGRATATATATKSGTVWNRLNNLLMQLRIICVHPYMIQGVQPSPYYLGQHVLEASSKFILLDKLIDDLVLQKREKIIIFSGFTGVLDCCEDLLHLKGGDGTVFRYCRLDGGTNPAQRKKVQRLFQEADNDWRIMLLSLKAGGLGLNLQAASNVIMLDQDFNPQNMLQAQARAHRIGQTKPVTIFNICTRGTVEEQMLSRMRKKLYLSSQVNGQEGTSSNEEDERFSTSMLKKMLLWGSQTLSESVSLDEMLSWDAATLIEKCSASNGPSVEPEDVDQSAWLAKMERVKCAVLDGIELQRQQEQSALGVGMDLTRADRREGKETTVMVDGFAISKESMNCAQWEAVPTLAGKNPALAEIKRDKKPVIQHQEHCHACKKQNRTLLHCASCPRSYHNTCAKGSISVNAVSKQWRCPQHQCFDCSRKVKKVGGMLYCCRDCEKAYCDDCIDWDETSARADSLPELEALGFSKNERSFYLRCPGCSKKAGSSMPLASGKPAGVLATTEQSSCETPFKSYVTTPGLAEHESPGSGSIAEPTTPVDVVAETSPSMKRKFEDWTHDDAGLIKKEKQHAAESVEHTFHL